MRGAGQVLGWREVPVKEEALGEQARANAPRVSPSAVVAPPLRARSGVPRGGRG